MRAVVIDRDGVINRNRRDHVKSWEEFEFLPGVFESLQQLAKHNFITVVVTNQAIINRGIVSKSTVDEINKRMMVEVRRRGGNISGVIYCPHRPEENCDCRKPKPGLLLQAAKRYDLDLTECYMIGDAISDLEAAKSMGMQRILVLTGRGLRQFFSKQARNYSDYYIARDLKRAVKWILKQEGVTQSNQSGPLGSIRRFWQSQWHERLILR